MTGPPGKLSTGGALSYMPQLDGLRAVAITLVTVEHWLHQSLLNRALPTGFMGVRLFFVLSGFLITGILLKSNEPPTSAGPPLARFYARRFLRIFPIYYLTLAVCYVADLGAVRETLPWHLTYTSNVFYFLKQGLIGLESHFWTLAVEEQFYLVWPCLIVFTPRRHLRRVMVAVLVVGVLTRPLLLALGYTYILTFPLTCFDSFAIGGLLALAAENGRESLAGALAARHRLWGLNGLALVALFLFPIPFDRTHWVYVSLLSLHWSIFFAWLVGWASLGFEGLGGRVLANPVALYLGRISYGFYIFHPFVGVGVESLLPGAVDGPLGSVSLGYLAKYGATVAVASLSWHAIEAPINSLKNAFRYRTATVNVQ